MKPNKPRNKFCKARRSALPAEKDHRLETLRQLAKRINRGSGRFAFYGYLTAVYRLNRLWRRSGLDKVTARRVSRQLGLMRRKGSSPIRVIIEATYPTADHKQKSRWVRALEFAAEEKTPAKELIELFRSRGGIAGCAAHAAKLAPKRTVSRDDWAPRNKKTYVEAAAKRRSEKPASAVRAEDKLTWMSWFDPD